MSSSASPTSSTPDIACTRTVLGNGLVVIVHQDEGAAEISLSVCYRVGSKDEGPGQTGSAHLFEHLMFTGSANLPGDFMARMREAGANQVNAYTNPDYTRFFETFPPNLLDFALYAEADRMGSFREHLQAECLAQQQAIVLEEKAQRESTLLGALPETINAALFPVGHPYRHTVIGSAGDIAGMTLDAAREWHCRYYGPDNAVIVIAGPVDPSDALARVSAQFGHVRPSGRFPVEAAWVPTLPQRRRQIVRGTASHGGVLHLIWPMPEATDPASTRLGLIANLLASNESSPLWIALVRPGHALGVSASVVPGAICGQFVISIFLDTGADHRAIEEAAWQVLQTIMASPLDQDMIDRYRGGRKAGLTVSLDSLAAKVEFFISGEMLWRDPMHFLDEFHELEQAGNATMLADLRRWLASPPVTIDIVPTQIFAANATARPDLPAIAPWDSAALAPHYAVITSASGLRQLHIPRPGARDFILRLELPRGNGSETDAQRGIATLLSGMPLHGIGSLSPEDLRKRTDAAGIQFIIGSTTSMFCVQISGPTGEARWAAALLTDIVLHPRIDAKVLEESKREQIRELLAMQNDTMAKAMRFIPGRLYGAESVEVRDPRGTGETILATTPDDILDFHRRLFDPKGATVALAGDPATIAEVAEALQPLCETWSSPVTPIPPCGAAVVPVRGEERVHLVTAGSPDQAFITMAILLPKPVGEAERASAAALSYVLQQRLNKRLREVLRWTYGAAARVIEAELEGLPPRLEISSALNADHAAEAIAEIRAIFQAIAAADLIAAELDAYRTQVKSALMGSLASTAGLAAIIGMTTRAHNPASFSQRLDAVQRVNPDQVAEVAAAALTTGPMEWLVASTAPGIAARLRANGLLVVDVLALVAA